MPKCRNLIKRYKQRRREGKPLINPIHQLKLRHLVMLSTVKRRVDKHGSQGLNA